MEIYFPIKHKILEYVGFGFACRQGLLMKTRISPKSAKVQKAFQTYRFENFRVNQTQIPSLPSLPFSELVLIKHTLILVVVHFSRINSKLSNQV